MIDRLAALAALAEHGTMAGAATALRVTQSAVSKRISALEAELRRALVEPDGRRVRLTPDGERLLQRTSPALAQIRAALAEEGLGPRGSLVVGVSESVLAAWGARLLAGATRAVPGAALALHAHRSPVAVSRVRSGEYMLAVVAGESDAAPDLVTESLVEEPMAVVAAGTGRVPGGPEIGVLTIEARSASWRSLERRLPRLRREGGVTLRVDATVESFACAVQMARAGLGHALVPVGIARALGVPARRLVALPAPGLSRPVSLVGRGATLGLPLVRAWREALRSGAARVAATWDAPARS